MKIEFKNGPSIESFGNPNDVVRAVRVEDKMVVNVNGNLYQYLDGEFWEVEEIYVAPFQYEYEKTGKKYKPEEF